jgi:hypothetical protein
MTAGTDNSNGNSNSKGNSSSNGNSSSTGNSKGKQQQHRQMRGFFAALRMARIDSSGWIS